MVLLKDHVQKARIVPKALPEVCIGSRGVKNIASTQTKHDWRMCRLKWEEWVLWVAHAPNERQGFEESSHAAAEIRKTDYRLAAGGLLL